MKILRMPAVVAKTGLSRSSIYSYIDSGPHPFPAPVDIGPRAVGWVESDVDRWLDECARRTKGRRGELS